MLRPPPTLHAPVGIPGAQGDGQTDDTAAVQRYLNSGAPAIDLGPYVYAITAVTLPPTVRHIWGWGPAVSSFIPHPSKADKSPLLSVNGAPGIIIESLSSAGILATSCPDITIQNCWASGFLDFGMYIISSPRAQILRNKVTGPGARENIRVASSPNSLVQGNRSFLNATFGIAIQASDNSQILANYCETSSIEGIVLGLEGAGGAQGGIIVNNIIKCMPGHHDLGMSFGLAGQSIQNIIITGNYIQNPWLSGIALSGDNQGFQVSGNTILGACQGNDASWNGSISLMGSPNTAFNSVYGNTFIPGTGHAVWGVKEFNGYQNAGNPDHNTIGVNYGNPGSGGWASTVGLNTQVLAR